MNHLSLSVWVFWTLISLVVLQTLAGVVVDALTWIFLRSVIRSCFLCRHSFMFSNRFVVDNCLFYVVSCLIIIFQVWNLVISCPLPCRYWLGTKIKLNLHLPCTQQNRPFVLSGGPITSTYKFHYDLVALAVRKLKMYLVYPLKIKIKRHFFLFLKMVLIFTYMWACDKNRQWNVKNSPN